MYFTTLTSVERLKVAFDAIFEGTNVAVKITDVSTLQIHKKGVQVCTISFWPLGSGGDGNEYEYQLLTYLGAEIYDTEHRYRYEVFMAALSAIDEHR